MNRALDTSFPVRFMTTDGKCLTLIAYAFLTLLCFTIFVPGLVSLPATDRDESLFAQASKQMIESDNYVDIHVQDKPRYKKPIGIYWFQAASVKLFNPEHLNEIWAYRIPSLLGATLAVIMTAAIGALLFDPITGFIAALMMAGCVMLNVEARLAKTDAALLASVVIAQYALARAYIGIQRSWLIPLLFWTALGIGILIKGPIILMVLASTLVWLRVTEKNLIWFKSLRPYLGIPYLILLTMPWFIAIAMQSHGQFLQDSAGHDFLDKIWHGQDRGLLPPGVYFLLLPIVFFPFSIFALLGMYDAWANRHKPSFRFLIGWIVPFWIVFELSLTKLPHYVLPVYPAIAILSAKIMIEGYPVLIEKNKPWIIGAIVVVWLAVGAGFAVCFSLLPYFMEHSWNLGEIVTSALLTISQMITLAYIFKRKTVAVIASYLGGLVFLTFTLGITLPQIDHLWITRQVVQIANAFEKCHDLQIISASYDEPSLILTAGTGTRFSVDGADLAQQMQNNECLVGVLDKKHLQRFIDAFSDNDTKPLHVGEVDGFNLGAGRKSELGVYIMPPKLP